MLQFTIRRLFLTIPTLFVISMISFFIIQLPPGSFITSYAAGLAQQGEGISGDQLIALENAYGLNQPVYVQYFKWITNILFHGDFGQSFEWKQPVADLIWQRMGLTLALTITTLIFTWLLAIPIGVFSATHRYSKTDYLLTGLAFVGLGVPGFLLALVILWISFKYFGLDAGGLFSPDYRSAPWGIGKDSQSSLAPLDPPVRDGVGRDGWPDPSDARQHPGRTEQSLRHRRARPWTERAHADLGVPGARCPEPLRQHGGMGVARPDLRRHDHRHRARHPDASAAPPPRPAIKGHVPRRRIYPAISAP